MTTRAGYMLSEVTIRCPDCARNNKKSEARFIFSRVHKIQNKDLDYFQRSKSFEVRRFQDSCGGYWKGAVHYPGIGTALEAATDLPEGYAPHHWKHRQGLLYFGYLKDTGVVHCRTCHRRKKHRLNWPEEAYFQVEYKGQTLWAYDREYALKLLHYIDGTGRKKRLTGPNGEQDYHVQDFFLRKIPTHFQTAKARPIVVKKLRRVLDI